MLSQAQKETTVGFCDLDTVLRDRHEGFVDFEPISVEPTPAPIMAPKAEESEYEPTDYKPASSGVMVRKPGRSAATPKNANQGIFGLVDRTKRTLEEVMNRLKALEDRAYKEDGAKAAEVTQTRWMIEDLIKSF